MRPRGAALGILALLVVAAGTTALGATDIQSVVDIDGRPRDPLEPAGAANVLFFVATDCPISNSYAPEIQRICGSYRSRGVTCFLIYEDTASDGNLNEQVRKHLRDYRYGDTPVLIDRTRVVAKRTQASVTPQAVVIDRDTKVRYRGRIDNWYAAVGTRRRMATEHDLRDALDAILEGRPVRSPETEALGCFITDPASIRN
jgi:thiol-disulfide isomerase/thioredoxin